MSNIKEIPFPNGKKAQSVTVSADTPAENAINLLKIEKPKALILILGGAAGLDESLKARLFQLFSRSIACAAIETGAVIMDGGTRAGVMELIGKAVADQGRKSILLGVAPSGKVTYPEGPAEGSIENGAPLDPDHSHFVLVESIEWGGETEMMFRLAKSLSDRIPVAAILASGGEISRKEVLLSVRQGWPVIVIEGTGGLADEIGEILKEKKEKTEKIQISEYKMAEIIEDGDFRSFRLDGEVKELNDLIVKQLTINPTLKLAWERFALYDLNAMLQQKKTNQLQKSIIFLGVFATLFALTQAQLISQGLILPESIISKVFQNMIILIPISISIIVAASKKFQEKNKWILLRFSAESIKRAIFCYRTQKGMNKERNNNNISPEVKLAKEIESVSQELMKTDVNLEGLKPYYGQIPPKMYGAAGNDDGFSSLAPEEYIAIRLEDQLNYYSLKSYNLDKRLKFYYWSIYLLGGLGTYLATIGFELWVALTTSLAGAYISVLEFHKVEFTLTKYNQAATDLANVKVAWTVLSADQKRRPENINKLVIDTEKILQKELEGLIEAELKAKQKEDLNKLNQKSSNE